MLTYIFFFVEKNSLYVHLHFLCFNAENKEFMDKGAVFILPCSSTVLLLKLVEGRGAGLRNLE